VEPSDLPTLSAENFVPLDPKLLTVALIGRGVFAAIVIVAGVIAALVARRAAIPLAIMAGVLILIAVSAVLRSIEVRHIAYQAREHDISFRSGVITRQVETIPYVRVQHARVTSGPVERWFGLAVLWVNSAGPTLAINGLSAADAEHLRAYIVERAGALSESPPEGP